MTFKVTVRTALETFTYRAIGDINKVIDSAFDTFGVCGITVMMVRA